MCGLKSSQSFYAVYIKRVLDFLLATLLLVLSSPVLLMLSILVYFKLGSPILFKQERPGKDERIFTLYKFRTMTNTMDLKGQLLPDDVRLTPFGKFLRSTSLDELPELFNILKGEMSFIGPRPLLVSYLPLYNEEQRHRHDVRPGLTGLAQVYGRNALSWSEKFSYDIRYVRSISFGLDVKIFFKTPLIIFQQKGISSQTSATMEAFTGNEEQNG